MIEAKSTLFQRQFKRVFGHATELLKPGLGEAPKRLNPVDRRSALHEFISSMMDPEVPVTADIH